MDGKLLHAAAIGVLLGLLAGCPPPEGAPQADFSADHQYGAAPLAVQFTDLSLPVGPAITAWKWNFGDGSGSILQHPTHTFSEAGSYSITLTVTNEAASDTLKRTAYIVAGEVWAKTFGSAGIASLSAVRATSDDKLIVAGTVATEENGADIHVAKYNPGGALVWENTFGGSGDETASAIVETAGGDFLVTGSTTSGGALGTDVYLVKLSGTGAFLWEKHYGLFGYETGNDIALSGTNIIYIAGETRSYSPYYQNGYLVKVDATGMLYDGWPKTVETDGANRIRALCVSGEVIALAGETTGGESGFLSDMYAEARNGDGVKQWSATYGGIGADSAYDILPGADGAFLMCGVYTTMTVTGTDMVLVKLDNKGAVSWGVTFGGTKREEGRALAKASDGSYCLLGQTYSYGAGDSDFWLVNVDTDGGTYWSHTFGGASADIPASLAVSDDGYVTLAGTTQSFGAPGDNGYLLHINADGYGPSEPTE